MSKLRNEMFAIPPPCDLQSMEGLNKSSTEAGCVSCVNGAYEGIWFTITAIKGTKNQENKLDF